ncbi:SDR family oxidoreductase [Mycolicibacterium sp. BiH015]|uniref:SDR family NAD(P)-dependent oxidoreductase n=1 Tax=Mycolicibacterium sp. BiH015 TaxID=3018808 RepID=UPI0022E1851D|nr:SDR family oxidoreductase [Mycolicibacterium sp. BiH015]MDA2891383.1 SDR family oxidoreductase [Mycolicibacterium sp. BiH015]
MTHAAGRLSGKSAVITGAAFGIGRATAQRFASEGARLILTDFQREPLRELADELRGAGAIVCLSSISGLAGQKRQAAYGPAKFVATGLTKHLAVEWADSGIRVNAVAPGTIRTERVKRLPEEPGGAEYLDAVQRMHPMGRLGEPAEVASAIAFLASDEASFITGAVLPVDGGFLAQ